jgi:hypothetical protein
MTKPNGCTLLSLKLIGKQQHNDFFILPHRILKMWGKIVKRLLGPRADNPRQVQINDNTQRMHTAKSEGDRQAATKCVCHLAKSNVEDVGQDHEATIRATRGQPKASATQ